MDQFPRDSSEQQPRRWFRWAIHWQILFGLLAGGAAGLVVNRWATGSAIVDADGGGLDDRWEAFFLNVTDPLGKVFLRLIFMVVLPLVFSALALAVADLGSWRTLGRLGLRTLLLTAVLSTCAVLLGVGLTNLAQPGRRVDPAQAETLRAHYAGDAAQMAAAAKSLRPLSAMLLDIIPENPLQEAAGAIDASSKGNGLLAVMFFALAIGLAIGAAGPKAVPLVQWLEALNAVSMTIINFAMRLAPLGVACLVFGVTGRMGLSIVVPLAGFLIVVVTGYAVQLLLVYPLALLLLARRGPREFFRAVGPAMVTAFGTSSSNATLPTAIRVADERLRLNPDSSRFVLTLGATGNQNGTALYEGVVVLFLAQVFQVDLTFAQQLQVVLMAVLAGVGTAGIPGGSLPMIVVVMQSVGVPGEGIALILGIDRLLDMGRTVLNVTGDLAIAACVDEPRPENGASVEPLAEPTDQSPAAPPPKPD